MCKKYRLQLKLGPLNSTTLTDIYTIYIHTGNIVFDPLQGHPVLHLIFCKEKLR